MIKMEHWGKCGPFFDGEGPGEKVSDDREKDNNETQEDSGTLASCDVTDDDIESLNNSFAPKIWLEVLTSRTGTVLAAILTDIMTEGLTPEQENILGNFISSVGSLISYKAARDDIDNP